MKNKKLNFEILHAEKLSKEEQKSILGGDQVDPNKGNCCGLSTGGTPSP
jgi:natural product precursor